MPRLPSGCRNALVVLIMLTVGMYSLAMKSVHVLHVMLGRALPGGMSHVSDAVAALACAVVACSVGSVPSKGFQQVGVGWGLVGAMG